MIYTDGMSPDVSKERLVGGEAVCPPNWYVSYAEKLAQSENVAAEIGRLSTLTLSEVEKMIGGPIEDLPYDNLQTIFPQGSDDETVGALLRKKREVYLNVNPEQRVAAGAGEGVIGFDGRFWPIIQFNKMTPSERIGVMVGTTCFHYMGETPGMTSIPEDFKPPED